MIMLGPVPCQGCGASVTWNGKQWKVGRSVHKCPTRVRCGAFMPTYRERCARWVGHRSEHRSRYALDNACRRGVQ